MMTLLEKLTQRIRRRIESVSGGANDAPLFSLETLLYVVSVLYGAVVAIRARLYEQGLLVSRRLPCRVISIGNIVVGGTGKTPMTMFVAEMIRQLGYRVVVLSRGYRGRLENRGGVVSDGRTLLKSVCEAGDEPYLMAACLKDIPVVVGKDRYAAGWLGVRRFRPDVIVLDDAFQHLRLRRDLNLLLVDRRTTFGNGYILPRGRLREPLSALHRAQAFVFTRGHATLRPPCVDVLPGNRPIFHTDHLPVIANRFSADQPALEMSTSLSILEGKRVVAFSGLADNDQFIASLERLGCRIDHRFAFADHHDYCSGDLRRIAASAEAHQVDLLVTTAKDLVKIDAQTRWPVPLVALHVAVRIAGDEAAFVRFIAQSLV